jgi:predicted glycoside hydrolase/deacetylase ChbG (UPF0249 family)
MSEAVLMLCADDYGASPSISAGIDALARAGRLQAVSCMVTSPHWAEAAQALVDWPPDISLGLHFNLTEGQPLSPELRQRWASFPGLNKVLLLAGLRALPARAVASEWQAQWGLFADTLNALGLKAGHLDGHQHVHHLPGVRPHVVHTAAQHGLAVRHCGRILGPGGALKRRVIEATGGRRLRPLLARAGLAFNPNLTGAYDFQAGEYRALFRQWLSALPVGEPTLLFCHPGQAFQPGEPIDPIAQARVRELNYLASDAFTADLAAAGVRLGSAWRTSSAG